MSTKKSTAKVAEATNAFPQAKSFAHPLSESHHQDIKEKMLAVEDAAKNPGTAKDERQLKFDVADESKYTHLRVTLDMTETVIYDDTNVPSSPRPNGRLVSVLIDMQGTPGDKVTLQVTNASPKTLVCEIKEGTSNSRILNVKADW